MNEGVSRIDKDVARQTRQLGAPGPIDCALLGRKVSQTECSSASLKASASDFARCLTCATGRALAATRHVHHAPWRPDEGTSRGAAARDDEAPATEAASPFLREGPPYMDISGEVGSVRTYEDTRCCQPDSEPQEPETKEPWTEQEGAADAAPESKAAAPALYGWELIQARTGAKTKNEFSRLVRVSNSVVYRILDTVAAGVVPKGEHIQTLLDVVGVTMEELMGRPLTPQERGEVATPDGVQMRSWALVQARTGASSQTELAKSMGYSQGGLHNLLKVANNGNIPRGEMCQALLCRAGITMEELVGRPLTPEERGETPAEETQPPAAPPTLTTEIHTTEAPTETSDEETSEDAADLDVATSRAETGSLSCADIEATRAPTDIPPPVCQPGLAEVRTEAMLHELRRRLPGMTVTIQIPA